MTFMSQLMKISVYAADGECWLWESGIDHEGYARMFVDGKTRRVHRLSYEALIGPIPPGLVIDHICRVRNCVNPAHLRAVTNRENILCGAGLSAQNATKTHCAQGHEFTAENTYLSPYNKRRCLACAREWEKKYKQKKSSKARARTLDRLRRIREKNQRLDNGKPELAGILFRRWRDR